MPKIKSRFGVSKKRSVLEGIVVGEMLRKGVKKARCPVSQEALAGRSYKPKKQRFRYGYRRRCFFDFHEYDFYIKTLNIRRLYSFLSWLKTLVWWVNLAGIINKASGAIVTYFIP